MSGDGELSSTSQSSRVRQLESIRFEAESICSLSQATIGSRIKHKDCPEGTIPIVVFNPSGYAVSDIANVHLSFFERSESQVYDLTSSGLTQTLTRGLRIPNSRRIGEPFIGKSFGSLDVAWEPEDPVLRLAIHDVGW